MPNLHGSNENDQFTERQFYDFVNGAGNQELKLLTGALILASPDVVHTPATLGRTIRDKQGEPRVWNLQSSIPGSYCRESLEPSGVIFSLRLLGERGGTTTGYQAVKDHLPEKLSVAGSILGWSLDYPDLSVQQVLGVTTSSSETRSPEMRHRILTAIITGDKAKNVSQLRQALQESNYEHRQSLDMQLKRMEELKLIELSSNTGYDPTVQILTSEFKHSSKSLRDTLPETQAVYAAIRQIGQGETRTINQIVSVALTINPAIDPTRTRQKLLNGVVTKGYPGLKMIETEEELQRSGSRTVVRLGSLAVQPVTDLCERLKDARENDPTQNIQLAKRIIANETDFRALVTKARKFSNYVVARATGVELLESQLIEIVSDLGEVTPASARNALQERYGREISSHRLLPILNKLVNDNLLLQDVTYKHQHSQKSTRVFKLSEPTDVEN